MDPQYSHGDDFRNIWELKATSQKADLKIVKIY